MQNGETVITRRTFLKRSTALLGGGVLALLSGGGWSVWLEPGWIEVTRVRIDLRHLPAAFEGLRIVQFSDTHVGHFFDEHDLAAVVKMINELKPDLVCFTGDLMDSADSAAAADRCVGVLSRLKARHGRFAVLGNHDYWADPWRVENVFARAGFHFLKNSRASISKGGQVLHLCGIDDVLEGQPDLERAIRGLPAESCKILMAHEPDFADAGAEHPVDLQLSGHSHGGQVRVPFSEAPIISPPYGKKYPAGLRKIGERLTLYTNRGIGTALLPVRFSCRPEITVITLQRES